MSCSRRSSIFIGVSFKVLSSAVSYNSLFQIKVQVLQDVEHCRGIKTRVEKDPYLEKSLYLIRGNEL